MWKAPAAQELPDDSRALQRRSAVHVLVFTRAEDPVAPTGRFSDLHTQHVYVSPVRPAGPSTMMGVLWATRQVAHAADLAKTVDPPAPDPPHHRVSFINIIPKRGMAPETIASAISDTRRNYRVHPRAS